MIKLSQSCVGVEEINAVKKILEGQFLGMGPKVNEFEINISNFVGRHTVCVSTGTTALQLALEAVSQIKKGEVLVPSITYVASFQAIAASGNKPVACDIDPNTGCLDIKDLDRKINNNTVAIMPVYYGSQFPNIEDVHELALNNNLRVIEDAAHAFGCHQNGRLVGSFGDICCFSFDGIKNITCGEGGAVVSKDDELCDYIRDARTLGVVKESKERYMGRRQWEFQVKHLGHRFHMSDIMASIGIMQLTKINSFKQKRLSILKQYHNSLSNNYEIIPKYRDDYIPHICPVKVPNKKRNELRLYLNEYKIQTGIHYFPNHRLEFFASDDKLPNSDRFYEDVLTIPLHPNLTHKMVEFICDKINQFKL